MSCADIFVWLLKRLLNLKWFSPLLDYVVFMVMSSRNLIMIYEVLTLKLLVANEE